MDYKSTDQSGNSYSHMWDVSATRCFDGGFLFDKSTVPAGTEKIPRGAFLKVDHVERKATMIKTAVLHEAITAESIAIKVKKGALLVATDILGTAAKAVLVGAIDTSNAEYDTFAIEANAFGALAAGVTLQTYDAAGAAGKVAVNPDGLNYAEVVLDAQPSCSVIFEAKGIVTERLPQAVTAAIKAALKFCQFLS